MIKTDVSTDSTWLTFTEYIFTSFFFDSLRGKVNMISILPYHNIVLFVWVRTLRHSQYC